MGPTHAHRDLIRPHLDSYFGNASSASAAKPSPGSMKKEGVTAPFETGAYWSKTTQIDVVGLREDGWTDLGECK